MINYLTKDDVHQNGDGEDDIKNFIDLELHWSMPDDDAKDEVCTVRIWPPIAARAK